MQGPVTWETLIGMGVILGAVIGVWLRIEYRMTTTIAEALKPLRDTLQHIEGRFTASDTRISALHAEVRMLEKSLADHKLYAAEHYSRLSDVRNVRDEVIERLDKIERRIDEAVRVPTTPARPRG
ncbi:hypothetical protein G3545_14005 [Starkeya sp. ORNL1]|uniref:hypothetical protein n=1 Tax=Starkeya sp. ORNL1 TaxID=2709380 RepID=UPI001462E6F0|nr:hypothetical protein [Starkeya sp. ORNL1]QJP14657.1 hypothetical protein G3545_14005 [Starkeya sp. ORNL1]